MSATLTSNELDALTTESVIAVSCDEDGLRLDIKDPFDPVTATVRVNENGMYFVGGLNWEDEFMMSAETLHHLAVIAASYAAGAKNAKGGAA